MNDKLQELKDRLFMLQMQDIWTHEDYKCEDELLKEIKEIKEIKEKEDKKMKKKFYITVIDDKVKRVYEDDALKYAVNEIVEKFNSGDKEFIDEFAQEVEKWYFKKWGKCWEDVD